MLRLIAIIFGIAFIFVGVAGFLPTFTTNNLLFGIFEVGTIHNIFHLVSGVIAIMAATNFKFTKLYFQIFGIIFTLIAITGFWRHGDLVMMQINTADSILLIIVGVIALYLGFAAKRFA